MTPQELPLPILCGAELPRELPAEQIMSMPDVRRHRWTSAEVEQLVDSREGLTPRYELVQGELLVTPAPTRRHQRLVLTLALLLQRYLTAQGLGEVFLGPGELRLVEGERYEPDLFVLPAANGRRADDEERLTAALLICEVLSPGSTRHDRITKRRAFQRNGVPTYWIMDGEAEAFEVWHPGDERGMLVDDRLVWHPDETHKPFELDLHEFFASVRSGGPLP
jgi:Uma2 family endonuclease